MRRFATFPLIVAALAVVAFAPAVAAAPWKLATLVPDGSVWDRALREMSEEFSDATDGRVSLRVYPGGVAGDETDIVRKLRIGQLHAAALTTAGLSEIDEGFSVFSTPLLFQSYDELFGVLEAVEPELRRRLADAGFELLHWGHGGWVHVFSKERVATLADLKGMKLFAWAGDDARVQLFRTSGFQPVALASTDVLTGLQTGLIEAYPTTPLAALSLQWFRQTPHMSEIGLAPLVGAVIVSRRSFDRLDDGDREQIRQIARGYGERLAAEIPEQDEKAVTEMKQRGLTVVPVEDEENWHAAARDFVATSRGDLVPAGLLDTIVGELEALRAALPPRAETTESSP